MTSVVRRRVDGSGREPAAEPGNVPAAGPRSAPDPRPQRSISPAEAHVDCLQRAGQRLVASGWLLEALPDVAR